MRVTQVGLWCIAAAAVGTSAPVAVLAGTSVEAGVDGFATGVEEQQKVGLTTEPARLGDATIPLPTAEEEIAGPDAPASEEEVAVEGGMSQASKQLANFAENLKALAQKYGPGKHRGSHALWVGAMGLFMFMLFHAAAQHSAGKRISSEVFFKENGKVTFTGAGSLMSIALLLGGLFEALRPAKGAVRGRSTLAKHYVNFGTDMMLKFLIAIAVGWLVSAPIALMQIATLFVFTGLAYALLGGGMLLYEVKRSADALKALRHAWDEAVEPMQQTAGGDDEIWDQALEHFSAAIAKSKEEAEGDDGLSSSATEGGGVGAGGRVPRRERRGRTPVPDIADVDVDAVIAMIESMMQPKKDTAATLLPSEQAIQVKASSSGDARAGGGDLVIEPEIIPSRRPLDLYERFSDRNTVPQQQRRESEDIGHGGDDEESSSRDDFNH